MNDQRFPGNKTALFVLSMVVLMVLIVSTRQNKPVADTTPPPGVPSSKMVSDRNTLTVGTDYHDGAIKRRSLSRRSGEVDLTQLSQAILQRLQSTNLSDRDEVFTNLLSDLISRDPAFAAKLAQSLAPENGREDALRRVAQEWGATDPEAALAWAEQLPDAAERKSALTDATTQLAQTDPAKAVELAEQHRLDDTGGLMGNLAMLWAQKDLASALDWAGHQPTGDQKNEIIARIAFVESQTSPLDAANRVVRDIPPGPAQEEAVMSVLNQWANRDFASASAWVERFPEGPFRDRAIAELKGILTANPSAGSTSRAPSGDAGKSHL